MHLTAIVTPLLFLSTPSGWRATRCLPLHPKSPAISIHALRVEGDLSGVNNEISTTQFISTPSGWRATAGADRRHQGAAGISIHALRVEGDGYVEAAVRVLLCISIHALRVEGDLSGGFQFIVLVISIHALRVEGDLRSSRP